MKEKIKKILKVFLLIIVVCLIIFIVPLVYKLGKYKKIANIENEIVKSNNYTIKIESFSEYNEEAGIKESQRIGYNYNDNIMMHHKTTYFQENTEEGKLNSESKMYFYDSTNESSSLMTVVSETDKTLTFVDSFANSKGIIASMYPSFIGNYLITNERSLFEMIGTYEYILEEISRVKFISIKQGEEKYLVAETKKNDWVEYGDDVEYINYRIYYDYNTLLPIKKTKLKKDGTEKLVEQYEIKSKCLVEADVIFYDDGSYKQVIY